MEISERVGFDGEVLERLDDEALRQLGDRLAEIIDCHRQTDDGMSIAVNLLFAYANPTHEARIRQFLGEHFPDVPISTSHEVSPVWREYERASTTILDAYVKPSVGALIRECELGLGERGCRAPLSVMKSNGGQMLSDAAASTPAETVLSGLAGGIVAGRFFGERAGRSNLITLDMGGTSADVGIVADGEIGYTMDFELDFGLPISGPAIDLTTVGSGGGSIARIDEGGLLQVGPQSAGARPGPVCYDLGGEDVTVTDANLVLGRLDSERFLGGEMRLNRDKALARTRELARELGLGVEESAEAIIDLASHRMANAMRTAAIERGADPGAFDLVAFGGAGPLHASAVAESLAIDHILVPPHPGLTSALGTLLADRRVDRRWTSYYRSDVVDFAALNDRFAEMEREALGELQREGYAGEPSLLRSISVRYAGQNYESEISLQPGRFTQESLERLIDSFHARHEEVYGYAFEGDLLELIHFNVSVIGASEVPEMSGVRSDATGEPSGSRDVHFPAEGWLGTPIYTRDELPSESRLTGPAIIEETDSTTLVPPGWELTVRPDGILELESGAAERRPGITSERQIDSVTMSVINDHLVNITEEMGSHMMRSSYSPIFSESRDFSCALFNGRGEMIAQGPFSPAHLGAIVHTVRCVLAELDIETFEPGDVLLHNDPFRGGCHMPEHMLLAPLYHDGELVGFGATIGHLAEIGAMAVGSFASNATEVFQEGLRLPPVKLIRRGEPVADIWKIILTNHRTPRSSWGDLHAMIGSLRVAERRLSGILDSYGRDVVLAASHELIAYGERLTRAVIEQIPDGEYTFDDAMEDDGITDEPARMRVTVVVEGDRLTLDFTGTAPQARGPVNATYGVTTSAAYNAVFQLAGVDLPRNAGLHRCVETIAPAGTVVNVEYPGPSVGGNTETQPKIVGMILGALSSALPERVMAAEGVTSCNFLFGGIDHRTDQYYAHYHFEASGWGGRYELDGNSAQNHIHGNCRNTPVEVFETRFPFVTKEYGLIPDSGGAGRRRGGLATRRILEVVASEVTVSAMMDRVKEGAWGLFGGEPGRCAAILVRRGGESDFKTFPEAFGTVSPSKFANIALTAGDEILIDSAGGGGYGPPREREPELVTRDVEQGFVSQGCARELYGVSPAA